MCGWELKLWVVKNNSKVFTSSSVIYEPKRLTIFYEILAKLVVLQVPLYTRLCYSIVGVVAGGQLYSTSMAVLTLTPLHECLVSF